MAESTQPIMFGLDLNDLEHTTQAEVDDFMAWARREHASLYVMTANTVWLENRPDVAKLHYARVLPNFFREQRGSLPVLIRGPLIQSLAQLHTYIYLGFEDGIRNEFRVLQGQGVSKAQLMEITMAAQVYAGMRGLQHVYRAVAPFIRDFQDRPTPATFPEGWVPDPDAFTAGLDTSTFELTERDRAALTDWYVNTIGEVPKWVTFLARAHPNFLKAYRLRWEASFRGALPKQVMPVLMIYQNVLNGYANGVRQAVLLGKAWGLSREWLLLALIGAAYYYTGMEGLDLAEDALRDLFP